MPEVKLELANDKKTGLVWENGAIAIVTDDRGRPAALGTLIQFFMDLEPCGDPVKTVEGGRAIQTFTGIEAGDHVFEAQMKGTAYKSRLLHKNFKDSTNKDSKVTLTCRKIGRTPNYTLRLILSKAVNGVKIFITDLSVDNRTDSVETKEHGTVCWTVPPFDGVRKQYLLSVPDFNIRQFVYLFQRQNQLLEPKEVN